MSKCFAFNVLQTGSVLGYDYTAHELDDPEERVLQRQHTATVLIKEGADVDLIAEALEDFASKLRGGGLQRLYQDANFGS